MSDEVDDVAALILSTLGPLDTYRLHKLVYYAQAWHLAQHGQPLFNDEVEAWAQGPVVRRLYRRGTFGVVSWPAGDHRRLSDRGRDVITWVIDMYGSFSGDELSRMTHAEAPWRLARAGVDDKARSDQPIDRSIMANYYSRLRMSPQDAVLAAVGNARLEGSEPFDGEWTRLHQIATGERAADDVVSEILAKYRR